MTASTRPCHNLPTPPRPLVGRADELAQLLAHLRDPACRLVTVTGPGGAGKTRFALAAALALAPGEGLSTPFSAGVFLVPLSALDPATSAERLATVIADAVGVDLGGEALSRERLAAAIGTISKRGNRSRKPSEVMDGEHRLAVHLREPPSSSARTQASLTSA